MTQSELAEAVSARGMPFRQQTVVKIEKGQRPLRLREADAIADALGVGLDFVVLTPPTFKSTAVLVHRLALLEGTREELNAVSEDRGEPLRGHEVAEGTEAEGDPAHDGAGRSPA